MPFSLANDFLNSTMNVFTLMLKLLAPLKFPVWCAKFNGNIL